MKTLRNVFALIGLLAVVGFVYLAVTLKDDIETIQALSPDAPQMYANMWKRLKETGTSADATVWKVPLADGISIADAEQVMDFVANEYNIKGVGKLPLSEQVALMTGEKQRFLKIYEYCDPLTAMKMVDYSDAFSAYLPCRIALVEDKQGKYALYSLNMDLMISGGKPLPADLQVEADKVKKTIREIMRRGASGEF
jgi:hypothetical protein